ncbi:MAG: RNA methyltransferase [Alkalispirochaeta sp.]
MTGNITKNQIKKAKALHQKKFRDQYNSFLIEGVKLVGEALAAGAHLEMIAYRGKPHDFPFKLPETALPASTAEMTRMSALKTAPPILAVCRKPQLSQPPAPSAPSATSAPPLPIEYEDSFFALDGVSDPGNLGTILRICDWFGFTRLVCTPDCVDVYNPKVVQASMGAIFRVHTVYTPLEPVLNTLPQDFGVWAADMAGRSLYTVEFPRRTVFIFGSEAHGLRTDTQATTDGTFAIPRYGAGESLNVAVAVAITAAELQRRKFH